MLACNACGGTGLHGYGSLLDLPRNADGELVAGPLTLDEWATIANLIIGLAAVYALLKGR